MAEDRYWMLDGKAQVMSQASGFYAVNTEYFFSPLASSAASLQPNASFLTASLFLPHSSLIIHHSSFSFALLQPNPIFSLAFSSQLHIPALPQSCNVTCQDLTPLLHKGAEIMGCAAILRLESHFSFSNERISLNTAAKWVELALITFDSDPSCLWLGKVANCGKWGELSYRKMRAPSRS
jgi:hypothetical protein